MNRRDAIKAAIGAVGAAALAPAVSEGQEFTRYELDYKPAVGFVVFSMHTDAKAFTEGMRRATLTINEARIFLA